MDAVASAMQQLHQIRLQDQLHRPLRYEPRDRFHQPDVELLKKFDTFAHDEMAIRPINTNDWLRVAVWWLLKRLKARTTLANYEKSGLSSNRGSLNLLKASYILYDIVLKDKSSQAVLTDENRKLVSDLSEGIKEDFSQFSSVDIPEYSTIHSQNIDIWEPLQPEEEVVCGDKTLLGLENVRWIAVDQDDAGNEEEKVLFRTFVNAGIGSKRLRMRTKGAPYMLLLSTREGESEPKITICNQSGTLCLQRDLSHASLSGFPGAKISEPIVFKFGSKAISISFQYAADLMQFINIPKAYFDAVWQREPIDSDQFSETILFRSSLESFEQLKAPTMKPMNPPMVHGSCEVRILERSFGEAWRSMRRMVISSSAAERIPRCMELFMPMSRVQVCREEDSRQVLVKWSDTRQERSTKTDGNYHTLFSYVYDDSCPNIGMSMHFGTQQQAEIFENAILNLSSNPIFSWTQTSSAGQVYDVEDAALDQKQYKAVLLLHTRLSWRYCNLYYLYRDTDFIYEDSSLRIRFPHVFYTDYISSHVDKLYQADSPVFFSHYEKRIGNFTVDFNHAAVMRGFMSSLASSYELVFSRRAVSLATKGKTIFGSKKSTKGDAEVQVWRKGNTVRLASRWQDHIPDKWLTMSISSGLLSLSADGTRVDFPPVNYSRGMVLNMASIMAGAPRDPNMARKHRTITITFPTANGEHSRCSRI
ncbi:hypothetical protein EYZ11_005106 [Aspergillus tanneri]|uniref:Uncharacterized protein n=1 Tax=Aspergillus tanneri TaxID=1220188 RepID=A0A4S3JIS9_9EURO|nr:hypothetical protein EYZ11_005106 [Aspergillus tanneri]